MDKLSLLLVAGGVGTVVYAIYVGIKQATATSTVSASVEEEEFMEAKLSEKYLTLDNYIGQTDSIEYLRGHIREAKSNDKSLPHIVLWGLGGLGKSSLIKAVAHEMGGRYIEIVPANLRNVKDLFGILFRKKRPICQKDNHFSRNKCFICQTDISLYYNPVVMLRDKDIVFLEECHGLKEEIEEALYSFMQDGYIMLRYNGMDKRVMMPNVTIAGATTRLGDLNKPFRDRFKIDINLVPYLMTEMMTVIKVYADSKSIMVDEPSLQKLAEVACGNPRIAKKYLEDCATRNKNVQIDTVKETLGLLGVDEYGLNRIDRKILAYINSRKQAGSTSIASSANVSNTTYLEIYEPRLLYLDFVSLGPRGRTLTEKAKRIYFNA